MYFYEYGTSPAHSKITVPSSSSTVVKVSELREHLGLLGDSSDDTYLERILLTATDTASNYTGYDIELTSRQDFYTDFSSIMKLSSRELHSSGSALMVQYFDTSEVLTTVPASVYITDTTTDPVCVRLRQGQSFPNDLSANVLNPIVVSYESFLNEENSQIAIKHAIYMYASELYNNPDNTTDRAVNALPLSAERLLSRYSKVVV